MKSLQQCSDGKTHRSWISWLNTAAAGLLCSVDCLASSGRGGKGLWPLTLGLAKTTNSPPYIGASRRG